MSRRKQMMMMMILYVPGIRAYHLPLKGTWVFGEMADSGSGIINMQDDSGTFCHTRKQRSFQRLIHFISEKTQKVTCIHPGVQRWYNFKDGLITQWTERNQIV